MKRQMKAIRNILTLITVSSLLDLVARRPDVRQAEA